MAEGNRRDTEMRRAYRRRQRMAWLAGICMAGISLAAVLVSTNQSFFDADASELVWDSEKIPLVPPLMIIEDADVPAGAIADFDGLPKNEDGFEALGSMEVTAYCAIKGVRTYSGEYPTSKHTAAGKLSVFEIGDWIRISGTLYEIEDKVEEDSRELIRIYFDNSTDAYAFGRQELEVDRRPYCPEMKEGYLGEFEVTGYCSCEKCCGQGAKKLTKAGTVPRAGYTIAADPDVIPLGSSIEVDSVLYLVEDVGNLVKQNVLDIYFDTHEEAVQYGRRRKSVYLK